MHIHWCVSDIIFIVAGQQNQADTGSVVNFLVNLPDVGQWLQPAADVAWQ